MWYFVVVLRVLRIGYMFPIYSRTSLISGGVPIMWLWPPFKFFWLSPGFEKVFHVELLF